MSPRAKTKPQTAPKKPRNRVKCLACGEVIESKYRHDFKWCKCGTIAVDGGPEYRRRIGELDKYREMP